MDRHYHTHNLNMDGFEENGCIKKKTDTLTLLYQNKAYLCAILVINRLCAFLTHFQANLGFAFRYSLNLFRKKEVFTVYF